MPKWEGKWEGGRYYSDAEGRPVFFIERRVEGHVRQIRLKTHDRMLALGELARFLDDPVEYVRPPPVLVETKAVYITTERIALYLASIRKTVEDHYNARKSYLAAWATLGLDLRTADRRVLRAALGQFKGGHRGRTEALNAFGRFLVKEGDLPSWIPLVNTHDAEATRAEREAYDLKTLGEKFETLKTRWVKDAFHLRVATGMHHTEIEQLEKCKLQDAPLPDKGVAIRRLTGEGAIAGVLQVKQKTKPRHRISVDAYTLAAAERLREGVPDRVTMWKALDPLVPSNLRHTWVTLCGEFGELVTYTGKGVDLDRIAEIAGHRPGSAMTGARYDKLQVPPMIRLPLPWL